MKSVVEVDLKCLARIVRLKTELIFCFLCKKWEFQIPQSDDVHLFKKKKELYCSIAKRKEKSNALWIVIKAIRPHPELLLRWSVEVNYQSHT